MDGALVHHPDELEVVRDDDDGGALLVDRLEELHDADGVLVVEVAGRLIRDQNFRAVDQCAGDGGTLLLAATELARIGIVLLTEADALEHLRDICPDLRGGFTGDQLGEADVLIDGTVLEEPEVLEDDAETATVLRDVAALHVLQCELVYEDLALRRLELLREEADERGFTGAAAPDDEAELAIRDGETDISEGLNAVFIAFGNVFDFNHSIEGPLMGCYT